MEAMQPREPQPDGTGVGDPGSGSADAVGTARRAWVVEDEQTADLSELVQEIVRIRQDIAGLQAQQARVLERARQAAIAAQPKLVNPRVHDSRRETVAHRILVAEIACATRTPARTIERLVSESYHLVTDHPEVLAALARGAISYQHARVLLDANTGIPDEMRDRFEDSLLATAFTTTAAKLKHTARIRREREHPDALPVRVRAAATLRRVEFEADQDGMAWLHHYLPAVDAARVHAKLSANAEALKRVPGEERTIGQLRADVLTDLLLENASRQDVRATVLVTVPALTLLGRSEEPGSLEGYGPIDPETARTLVAGAPSFTRLLTHPETGAVLSVGRDSYTVPADMRTWLRARDGTCRHPGCRRKATACDADHTIAWENGGETRVDNLAMLCPYHHHLKHDGGWSVIQDPDSSGRLHWISPLGAQYITEPELHMAPYGAPDTKADDTVTKADNEPPESRAPF